MKKHTLFAASAAGVTLACAMPAAAQSIDYGALEELFSEPVTTSATGSPQRAPEAPADMQIISQEDIRRSGAFDLPTIISRVAGPAKRWGVNPDLCFGRIRCLLLDASLRELFGWMTYCPLPWPASA